MVFISFLKDLRAENVLPGADARLKRELKECGMQEPLHNCARDKMRAERFELPTF